MNKILLLSLTAMAFATSLSAQNVGDVVRNSKGKYQVTGQNMITNGDFSQGLTSWKSGSGNELSSTVFATTDDTPTGSGKALSVLADKGSTSAVSDSALLDSWKVDAGKLYLFSYYVKSGTTDNITNSSLYAYQSLDGTSGKDAANGYDNTDLGNVVKFGTAWKQVQYVFNGQGPYFVMNFYNLAAQEKFANFFLGEVTEVANTDSLQADIDKANQMLSQQDIYVNGRDEMQGAIDDATSMLTSTSVKEVNDAILALEYAMKQFAAANTIDLTSRITNADFASNAKNSTSFKGWTSSGFKGNVSASYTSTDGSTVKSFVEQWTSSSASSLRTIKGSGDVYQVLSKLPAGTYVLAADAMATQQGDASVIVTGAQLHFNDQTVDVATGNGEFHHYTLTTKINAGETLTLGYKYADFTGNWLAVDNFKLSFVGDTVAFKKALEQIDAADAQVALKALVDSATTLKDNAEYPMYKQVLTDSINAYSSYVTSVDLTQLNQAQTALKAALDSFYNANNQYFALQKVITDAEAKIADESYKNGKDALTTAITEAKAKLAELTLEAIQLGKATMDDALYTFGVANASYAHPIAIVDNDCSSTTGWDILKAGANPNIHVNATGDVTGFTKPFLEAWVASNTNYGQSNGENYAHLTTKDNLPAGYYVLDIDVIACQQGASDPSDITGVTAFVNDSVKQVNSANGTASHYSIGYDLTQSGAITLGINIGEDATANWIGFDNVKLNYYGDKAQYLKDLQEAKFGAIRDSLTHEIARAEALKASVDIPAEVGSEDLDNAIADGNDALESGESEEEYIQALQALQEAEKKFIVSGVLPKAGETLDFTDLLTNPSFAGDVDADTHGLTGWAGTTTNPVAGDDIYWYIGGSSSKTEALTQTVGGLPAGNYVLKVRSVFRNGFDWGNVIPDDSITGKAYVTVNDTTMRIHNAFYKELIEPLGVTEYDFRHGVGTFMDLYHKGYYDLYVPFTVDDLGNAVITIGFSDVKGGSMFWISDIWLSFYGKVDPTTTAIKGITEAAEAHNATGNVYTLSGVKVATGATSVKGLPKGIYIFNGKKYIVR